MMLQKRLVKLIAPAIFIMMLITGIILHTKLVSVRIHDIYQLEAYLNLRGVKDEAVELRSRLQVAHDRIKSFSNVHASDEIRSLTIQLIDLGVRERTVATAAPSLQGEYLQTYVDISFRSSLKEVYALMQSIDDSQYGIIRPQRVEIRRSAGDTSEMLEVKIQLCVLTRDRYEP